MCDSWADEAAARRDQEARFVTVAAAPPAFASMRDPTSRRTSRAQRPNGLQPYRRAAAAYVGLRPSRFLLLVLVVGAGSWFLFLVLVLGSWFLVLSSSLLVRNECRRRGSNPHAREGHGILSPARLPVPPLRPGGISHSIRGKSADLKGPRYMRKVSAARPL
jgi:hypothetical protein